MLFSPFLLFSSFLLVFFPSTFFLFIKKAGPFLGGYAGRSRNTWRVIFCDWWFGEGDREAGGSLQEEGG